jgi:negative elongation factor B
VVSNLAQYVGDKILLYDLVLQFLRTLYLRTRYMHYCTLRAEVLMALHDTKVSKITSEDPCYKVSSMIRGTLNG